jgi:peptide methionine sulfoxide reductase MsrA
LFIEYNPKEISLMQILAAWRDNDYPWEEPESVQYRSALFLTDPVTQWTVTLNFLQRLARSQPHRKLHVDVEPVTTFYQAEDYLQNYMDKQAEAAEQAWVAWRNRKSRTGLFAIPE